VQADVTGFGQPMDRMQPADILSISLEEQTRARAIVEGLGACPIKVSHATTVLGTFLVDRYTGEIEIRISKHLRNEEQVRDTARHELAHQAAWQRYEHIGHGALWQTLASYLGCEPVPCTSHGFDPDVIAKRQRYHISCMKCGWATTRQRRSKLVDKPWRFACAYCGSKLQVVELAAVSVSDPATP